MRSNVIDVSNKELVNETSDQGHGLDKSALSESVVDYGNIAEETNEIDTSIDCDSSFVAFR